MVTPNEPVLLERYGPLTDAELRRIGLSEALLGFDYETTKGNLFERSDGRSSTNHDFHVSRWSHELVADNLMQDFVAAQH